MLFYVKDWKKEHVYKDTNDFGLLKCSFRMMLLEEKQLNQIFLD